MDRDHDQLIRHVVQTPVARSRSRLTRATLAIIVIVALAAAGIVATVLLTRSTTPSGSAPSLVGNLTGDLAAHDPALVAGEDGEPWFVYSTGLEGGNSAGDGTIEIRRSDDGVDWSWAGTIWDEKPEWLLEAVPGVDNLWAPDLTLYDGTWYLYYSASTFGSNRSVIGLATNTTLDPDDPQYEWVDRGEVIGSVPTDDFNAIDPGVTTDDAGAPWMAFGSFWSGIRMVPLDWTDGKRADDAEPLHLADRGTPPNAIEAPTIVKHDEWYYLFVSRDSCCRGVESTYNVAVGRSSDVAGPYLDRSGAALLTAGGTPLLTTDGDMIGPGGESASGDYLAWHFYDGARGGATTLAIGRIGWSEEGWPVIGSVVE